MNKRLLELKQNIGKEYIDSPSPFMKWLKPKIVIAEEGFLEFEYVVREEWLNPMGNLHGGITAAIIDDIIGATLISSLENTFCLTVNNVVDYFSGAKKEDKIIALTRIIKNGKQFVNAECEIWNSEKTRLIAKGSSNLFKTLI